MGTALHDSDRGRLRRLHLLPGRFRLALGVILALCVVTLLLNELSIRSARITAEQMSHVVGSEVEMQALRLRLDRAVTWSRIALMVSTFLAFSLAVLIARLARSQTTAERSLREQAGHDSLHMQEIIESRTSELTDLWSYLQIITEKEKADLARNLHDELGGLLTAARMDLSWLERSAAAKDPEVADKLRQLADGLAEAMNVKRRVVESLRPALLDHFGLPTALQNHFEEICKKAGLNCITSIPEGMTNLSDDVAIALFRVGQESLTNIIRHASARNVQLEISADGEDLTLRITDDGVGMNPMKRSASPSHGINGMRHRVESLGGKFDINSVEGAGTQIQIRIPRQQAE